MTTCGPVTLRPIEKRDMEILRGLLNDPDIARWLIDYAFPVSSDSQDEWFQSRLSKENAFRFMIEAEGKTVGTIVFSRIDPVNKTGEVGYKIARDDQGKNYATCALRAMQQFLFEEKGIECIVAYHFLSNISSRRVLEKAGFSYAGTRRGYIFKNGARQDVVYWVCCRKQYDQLRKDME